MFVSINIILWRTIVLPISVFWLPTSPINYIIYLLLGIGQVVRQWILVPPSGVRIPHPQPNINIATSTLRL